MKRTSMLHILVVCLVGFAMIFVGSVKVFAQEKQIKIRYATQLPATHLLTKAEFRMAKMIEEKTKGRVKVEVYPGGQLYKAMELLKAVMSGAVEMGTTPGAMFTGPVPLLDVIDIPFLFNSYDDVVKLWNGEPGEMMRKHMEKISIKAIAFSAYGENMSFCSHKPLIKPEDFKGLKIRCNTNMGADLVKAFGASPVVFNSGEVYEALQRKTIDAASSGLTSLKERKWYEVTSNATFTYGAYSLWPVMVNLKFFNSLPKDIQQVLIEIAKDHQAYVLKETAKEDAAADKFLRTKLKVYDLTDKDKKIWADAGQKAVIDKWLKRAGDDGKKTLEWVSKNLKR